MAMPASVKLIVNMDKDLPGTNGELPPVQLSFVQGHKTTLEACDEGPAEATRLHGEGL